MKIKKYVKIEKIVIATLFRLISSASPRHI